MTRHPPLPAAGWTRRRWLGTGLLLPVAPAGLLAQPAGPAAGGDGPAAALHALFERYWDETARLFPEWATYRGDHRFGDRLSDVSPEAEAAHAARMEGWLAEARAVPAEALGTTDRVSRAMFIGQLEQRLRLHRFEGLRSLRLGLLGGAHAALADLLQQQPVRNPRQVGQLLARLAAVPGRLDQEIAWLERGIALGWVSPRPVLGRVLVQLDGQLAAPVLEGPFFEPFRRLDRSMTEDERTAAQARGETAIRGQVLPAMQRLRRFVAERYLPAAPPAGGLGRYPGGAEVYAELVREHTTTTRTPAELHATGLAELDRLHAEFRVVVRALGLQGSFAEAVARLNGRSFRFASPEQMLEAYRATAKRLDPEMPRLFAELPRSPYGIRPMAAHLGPGAADNYRAPPADGSGPGWYNANVLAFERRPRWALPTLVAHETVPGHHLQIGRSRELGALPAFRRQSGYTAFSEGWALYAERLMDEVGFYATPEDRFGFLQSQAFRAARLVVDTGLHALGWDRRRAIDFMVERCGESELFLSAEVDRYLSTPGQALAYMTGQLHILELRERARQALGERFDLRRFNNAVIDQGSLPLDVLTAQIDAWVAAERG